MCTEYDKYIELHCAPIVYIVYTQYNTSTRRCQQKTAGKKIIYKEEIYTEFLKGQAVFPFSTGQQFLF